MDENPREKCSSVYLNLRKPRRVWPRPQTRIFAMFFIYFYNLMADLQNDKQTKNKP